MGRGLIKAITCPGVRGSGSQNCLEGPGGGHSDSISVLGVEGSEKKCDPPSPEDNFWNSPNDELTGALQALSPV